MAVTACKISTKLFHWEKESQTLSADASDLIGYGWMNYVWNDSADRGMILVSEHTGNEVIFVLEDEKRDSEGDITMWIFRSYLCNSAAKNIMVVVYND